MQCSVDKLKFYKGEIRKVTLEVKSCLDEEFSILKANVEIKQYSTVALEITPTISEHDIIFTIDTTKLEKAKYKVYCEYMIADETLIDVLDLEVK